MAFLLANDPLGNGFEPVLFGNGPPTFTLLDRLLHRSVVLDMAGESYRLRAHQARTTTLRKANRS